MGNPSGQTPRRILLRSANWVGDAIMSTPAIHAVRRQFPAAEITLLAKPWVVPVFTHSPDIDAIMTYEAADRHRGAKGLWRLAGDIRKGRFDTAILFQNAFEAAFLVWLARVPRRVGFTTDGRSLLLTDRIRTWRPLKQGHLVDYYRGLIVGAGWPAEDRRLRLTLVTEEIRTAEGSLEDLGHDLNRPLVGINPGATFGTAKRWPADRFVQVCRELRRSMGATTLVFGGPGEAALGREIADAVGDGCINLCGRTTLREAMALIGQCRLFITNDSGLMHVAAALDVPQVAIIGPTDPTATGPVNPRSRLIQAVDSCDQSPCLKPHCDTDHRCMTAISVADVCAHATAMIRPTGTQA